MSTTETLIDLISGRVLRDQVLRYDSETIEAVRGALDHARQLVQSSTPIVPRSFAEREKRLSHAKDDGAFQAFMRRALDGPKKPRRGAAS